MSESEYAPLAGNQHQGNQHTGPVGRTHGTRSAYRGGCRCPLCREAEKLYQRKRRGSDEDPSPSTFSHARWQDRAPCKGLTDLFFADGRGDDTIVEAKKICAGCPVRLKCLDAGLTEDFGVWGGLTDRQRNAYVAGRRGNEVNLNPPGQDGYRERRSA